MPIQILLLLILAAIFFYTWKRAKERVITRVEALSWSVLWIGAGVVVALPQTASYVARAFGVGRGADFVIYGSVILLFVLVFRVFVALDRIERKMTEFVRKQALKELPQKHDGK